MTDYMAAYHDAVLLIGQVMRKIVEKNQSEIQHMEYVNVNYFRNISFNGKKLRKEEGSKVGEMTSKITSDAPHLQQSCCVTVTQS